MRSIFRCIALSVAFEGPLFEAPFLATVRGAFLAFAATFLAAGFLTTLFLVDFAATFLAAGFLSHRRRFCALFFAAGFFCSGFLLCLCQGTSPLICLCHLSARYETISQSGLLKHAPFRPSDRNPGRFCNTLQFRNPADSLTGLRANRSIDHGHE